LLWGFLGPQKQPSLLLQELFLAVAVVYASGSTVLEDIAASLILRTQPALYKGLMRGSLKGRSLIEPSGDVVMLQLRNSSIVHIFRLPFQGPFSLLG
jgi:hypothetical protein